MLVYMFFVLLLRFTSADIMEIRKGALGVGRHASTILLGRNLWETPALPDNVDKNVKEPSFRTSFPPAGEALQQDMSFHVDT